MGCSEASEPQGWARPWWTWGFYLNLMLLWVQLQEHSTGGFGWGQ